ncbi:probable L-type lectin-domain containing receptor kinase S.5, partial [Haematococcus lacustris]
MTVGNEFTLEQLKKATNNFSEANRLGQGGFAVVYSGYLQQLEVAVKRPLTKIDPE